MATWTQDDSKDLVNLDLMEVIMLNEIDRGDDNAPLQSTPEGHTHEILAVTARQESYRLFTGDKESCEAKLKYLHGALIAI